MKKCPYCNEEIQDTAKKCRYCGEWIEATHKEDGMKVQKKEEKIEKKKSLIPRYDSLSENKKKILKRQRRKNRRGFIFPAIFLLRAREYSLFWGLIFSPLIILLVIVLLHDAPAILVAIVYILLILWYTIGINIFVLIKGRELAFNTSKKSFEKFSGEQKKGKGIYKRISIFLVILYAVFFILLSVSGLNNFAIPKGNDVGLSTNLMDTVTSGEGEEIDFVGLLQQSIENDKTSQKAKTKIPTTPKATTNTNTTNNTSVNNTNQNTDSTSVKWWPGLSQEGSIIYRQVIDNAERLRLCLVNNPGNEDDCYNWDTIKDSGFTSIEECYQSNLGRNACDIKYGYLVKTNYTKIIY